MAVKAAQKEEVQTEKKVAITFDDGPSPQYTPLLLEELRKCGVQATFFLMGKSIKGNEKIVRQMAEDGHLIGNHTYNHIQLSKADDRTACREIYKTNNLIYEITGAYPEYFRPPFGEWRKGLDLRVKMMPVLWDVDPVDWNTTNQELIVHRVVQSVKNGDIILLHDIYESSIKAAIEIVKILQQKGYVFVTVDRLLIVD